MILRQAEDDLKTSLNNNNYLLAAATRPANGYLIRSGWVFFPLLFFMQ